MLHNGILTLKPLLYTCSISDEPQYIMNLLNVGFGEYIVEMSNRIDNTSIDTPEKEIAKDKYLIEKEKEFYFMLESQLPLIYEIDKGERETLKHQNIELVKNWIEMKRDKLNTQETPQPIAEPEPIPRSTNPQNRIVIQWNEQNKVLGDIFRQLKNILNKDGEPVISNSYEEIAIFLKENFSCYLDTELSTIQKVLKTNDPPRTTRRIVIEKEK